MRSVPVPAGVEVVRVNKFLKFLMGALGFDLLKVLFNLATNTIISKKSLEALSLGST